MARPTFSLSDNEARQLVGELGSLVQRCPFNPRDHRPFVREFIGALHRITGRTYSPAIYRRLLAAYAPDRKPSTATLALEKERFAKDAVHSEVPVHTESGPVALGGHLLAEIRDALQHIAAHAVRNATGADSYLQAQCDFLQKRLSHTEKQLAIAREGTYQLEAQRQVLESQALQDREQIDSLRSAGAAMTAQLTKMSAAIDDGRQFALLAIDEARGETRAWKERCAATETQLKEQVSLSETFRRLAYRQGADIPPALGGERT